MKIFLKMILVLTILSSAAIATTYYSTGSVDPSVLTNWKTNTDGTGSSPASFITAGDVFIIQGTGGGSGAPHSMTAAALWAVGSASNAATLTVQSGAILQADFAITIGATSSFNLNTGATYIQNNTGTYSSTILKGIETFDIGSDFVIKNSSSTGPADPTGGFGNLTINSTTYTSNVNCSGTLTNIKGNFTIIATGNTGVLEFRLTGATALTLNIGGNLDIQGGILDFGNSTAAPVVNLSGNFSMSGGTLNFTGTTNPLTATLNFSKPGIQTFTKSAGTITAASSSGRHIAFIVLNGSTLDMGTSILNCAGSTTLDFTVNSGATIKLGDPAGIVVQGTSAITGNIQSSLTSIRSFSTGGNYQFTGSASQVTGSGLPATVNDLTINNASGVALSQPVTVNGVLTLAAGMLDNSVNQVTLGPGGTVSNTGGSISQAPLPVELTSFIGVVRGHTVELQWITATEINNGGFEVQKAIHSRLNGLMAWQKIGFVDGAGTSNAPHNYSFSDVNSGANKYSYRLKQIDRDGKFSYSNAVEVTTSLNPEEFKLSQNYPNPFNPSTKLNFAAKNAEQTSLKIYNVVGEEVTTLFNEVAQPNQVYTLTFDAKDLSSGMYYYVLHSASRNEVKKMILMK